MPRIIVLIQVLLLTFTSIISGQQYNGDPIANNLPSVPGAEISFWRVKDNLNRTFTLINYASTDGNGNKLITSDVNRVVIFIHGEDRSPGTYMSNLLSALAQVNPSSGPTFANTQIITPYFPNDDDKNYGYPWNSNAPAGGYGSYTNILVWRGIGWALGENNQYPSRQTRMSSFAVLDQLITYFGDRTMFPKLNQIVIAGHSLGAQAVQRYAAVESTLRSKLPSNLRISYWVANPDSLLWFNSSRPFDTSTCFGYDNWEDGLQNYSPTYGRRLVKQGPAAVMANYYSKSIAYARGLQDRGDTGNSCAPYTTGANREERFFNFIKWFPPTCTDPYGPDCDTVDYADLGSDAGALMATDSGKARLFSDNFYGDFSRISDVYCPRQALGDNPWPSPSCPYTKPSPSGYFYGMTYAGCWTDTDSPTLPYLAYQNRLNSVELCTSYCVQLGYSIAGLEFGTQCFCGYNITSHATITVDQGCYQVCPGNSAEYCGGANRLSMWSVGPLAHLSKPIAPHSVGSYVLQGCWIDNNPNRALSLKEYSSGSMTIEYCASYCTGTSYFGVEYGRECYCDDYISSGNVQTSLQDCNTPCSGNSSEPCGGANRLTLYTWVGKSSSSLNPYSALLSPLAIQSQQLPLYTTVHTQSLELSPQSSSISVSMPIQMLTA